MEYLTRDRMRRTAQSHCERRYEGRHYDLISLGFSEWEDTIEGETLVVTVKLRTGRGQKMIYEVWEYFFPRDEPEEMNVCQVARTTDDDAEDWVCVNMYEEARKIT